LKRREEQKMTASSRFNELE